MTLTSDIPASLKAGRVDAARLDASSQADIARHAAADDSQAMQDAAKFTRRVRRRQGLSQAELSEPKRPQ